MFPPRVLPSSGTNRIPAVPPVPYWLSQGRIPSGRTSCIRNQGKNTYWAGLAPQNLVSPS